MAERFSVVMCTRDGHAYVGRQLESIVAQTRPPDEIVVCDDASDDSTVDVVREVLAGLGSRSELVVRDRALGVAGNFADAIGRASGDVIVLCDQDDVWEPEKLAVLEDVFAAPTLAAFSDASLIDATGARLPSTLWRANGLTWRRRRALVKGSVFEQLLGWNCVTGATLAFRRALVPVALPLPPGTLHDEWLALLAASLGHVTALPLPLVRYRVHDRSAVGVPPRHIPALARRRRDDAGVRDDEVTRFSAAADRVRSAGGAEERVARLEAKARFAGERASLQPSAAGRARFALASLASARYHRYAHGLRSAVHDIVVGR